MKINIVSKILAAILTLSLLFLSTPVVAASSLTSGFAKIKDWDKAHEGFSFSSGQVTFTDADFFIAPRGIHVYDSPGIIDMGLIALDAIGEAPATGYVEMATPLDGHSYVVRSGGKYGKFYLEETYDWLDPVEYGISWVYQTNGARTFEGAASSAQPTTPGQTGPAVETGCTYEQYIAAYNKLTSLMAQGKGNTPEAQTAYAEYAKAKACYESGSSGAGQTTTPGQTGTAVETGCTYQDYITAYNKLNYLNSHGQANTPESKLAYEQYAKIKACYESGSSGTGSPATTTTTTTTSASTLLGQTFYYPYTNWTPYQNGQGSVSLQQSNLCINSMNAGGAWAETTRLHDISTEYTVELDFKVTEQDNHYIIIYSDGYLHLDIDWGTALSHFQPGAPYSVRQFPGNLQPNQWYRIRMDAHPSQGTFDVYIDGSKVSTATGLTATNTSDFRTIHSMVNCTDCIFFGDPDDITYRGGNYNRGSACWRNITVIGQPKGAVPQTTPTTTSTTSTSSTSQTYSAAGQTFSYPPSKWVPAQDGQSAVSLGQDQLCISSMKPGGAMAYTKRDYDITSDYTVEFDYMVGTDDNHWIIVYSDGYLFLIIDWGTQLSHCQTGRLPLHLEVNRWYKIRMDAFPGQGKYDVYADGVKLGTAVNLHVGFNHKLERGNLLTWLDKIYPAWDCIYLGDIDNEYFMAGRYNRGIACWKNITVRQSAGTTTSTITPGTEYPQKPGLDPSQIVSPPTTSTTTTTTTSIPAGTALIAESRTVAPGATIQVPVNFQNAQNVGSLGFKLGYNPSVVQVIKVSKGSLLASSTFTSNVQSDFIIFGFATPQSISGTGSAAVVEFQALGAEGSRSPLTLTEIMATGSSGATLSVNSVNGELSIGQKQIGDADGDGKLSVLDALIALKMYVQLLPLDLTADINKDGRVTPEDARLIIERAKP